jgi:hypothetical protein
MRHRDGKSHESGRRRTHALSSHPPPHPTTTTTALPPLTHRVRGTLPVGVVHVRPRPRGDEHRHAAIARVERFPVQRSVPVRVTAVHRRACIQQRRCGTQGVIAQGVKERSPPRAIHSIQVRSSSRQSDDSVRLVVLRSPLKCRHVPTGRFSVSARQQSGCNGGHVASTRSVTKRRSGVRHADAAGVGGGAFVAASDAAAGCWERR